MHTQFREISAEEFQRTEAPILFKGEYMDSSFGLIRQNEFVFKFAWQSTIVKPVILEINPGVVGVGIDLNFSLVDFNTNKVILNIELLYFFYKLLVYKNNFYVITELYIIKYSSVSYEKQTEYGLPDIFSELKIVDNMFHIKCFDGSCVTINP